MEKRISTTIFERDFDMLKTIASQKGFLWPMGTGKRKVPWILHAQSIF